MWFIFFPLFLLRILGYNPQKCAWIIFVGQLVDGVTNVVCGKLSDKLGLPRWLWIITGSIIDLVMFNYMFNPIWETTTLYYCSVYLFQAGWAMVQVNHQALLPLLYIDREEQSVANTFRATCSVLVITVSTSYCIPSRLIDILFM